jgi:hypothetical protein
MQIIDCFQDYPSKERTLNVAQRMLQKIAESLMVKASPPLSIRADSDADVIASLDDIMHCELYVTFKDCFPLPFRFLSVVLQCKFHHKFHMPYKQHYLHNLLTFSASLHSHSCTLWLFQEGLRKLEDEGVKDIKDASGNVSTR